MTGEKIKRLFSFIEKKISEIRSTRVSFVHNSLSLVSAFHESSQMKMRENPINQLFQELSSEVMKLYSHGDRIKHARRVYIETGQVLVAI